MKEKDYLFTALNLISEKFKWPHHTEWKRYHLTILSEEIFKSSDIRISIDTLRRLVGKKDNNENYDPQPATKEALARLLDFDNWDAFKKHYESAKTKEEEPVPAKKKRSNGLFFYIFFPIIGVTGLIAFIVIMFKSSGGPVFKEIIFDSNENPVPNTVSVSYKRNTNYGDSILVDFGTERFVKNETVLLNPDTGLVNFTYRIPGYYKIKVLRYGAAIDSASILAPSRGWESYIYIPNVNFLPVKTEFTDGIISLEEEKITKYFYPLDNIYSDFRYFKRFNISGDEMYFSAILRNNPFENVYSCQVMGLKVVGEYNEIAIDFNKSGCLTYTSLKISDFEASGKNYDLSVLEGDLAKPFPVTIKTQGNVCEIFTGTNKIISKKYNRNIGRILGIVFLFQGLGEAKEIRLSPIADSAKTSFPIF